MSKRPAAIPPRQDRSQTATEVVLAEDVAVDDVPELVLFPADL